MSDVVEWEWRKEDPESFDTLDAREIHAVYALGELSGIVALTDPDEFDDAEESASYNYYSVISREREGFDGYEPIDGFETLDEAKAFGDSMREEILTIIRDDV